MSKTTLLMGASALVAASLGMAGGASAQVTTQVYGGGGSLIAPTIRQIEDCFGNPTGLVVENSATTPATVKPIAPGFNYPGSGTTHLGAYNCNSVANGGQGPINPTLQYNYISSGSGAGGATFFSHNAVDFWGDTQGMNPGVPYPDVHYGEFDAGLATADVDIYNNGGVDATFKNVSVIGVNNPGGHYPNPRAAYGAVVQIPLLVTPVTFAFDPVYKKVFDASGNVTASFSFAIKKPNKDGSGGLVLDMPTACKIFNGQITLWSDPALTALNGAQSLKSKTDTGPEFATLPIELVGRSDSSGTSSIFTRALAAQCATLSGNQYSTGTLTLPTTVRNTSGTGGVVGTPGFTPQVGKFSLASGSGGVAGYTAFTATGASTTIVQGKLAYLSPDYVWPHVQFSAANAFHLDVANIQRLQTTGTLSNIEPTGAATLLAFGGVLPPQSDSKGNYVAGNPGDRTAPDQWVEPVSPTGNPLANPTNPKAYPIVGTTQGFFYTCYNETTTPGVTAAIKTFLTAYFSNKIVTDTKLGILAQEGFVPMPTAWQTALKNTFVTPITKAGTTRTDILNLNIVQGLSGPASGTGSQCHTIAGA